METRALLAVWLLTGALPACSHCPTPRSGDDPSSGAPYAIAEVRYDAGEWPSDEGRDITSVWYPAQGSPGGIVGPNAPFASSLARAPIVFIAHGNYNVAPSYRGYSYLQMVLARHGMIAVSISKPATDEARPYLQAGIARMLRENVDSGSRFHGKIDFGRVGLMGHSSGVVGIVSLLPDLPADVGVKAVLSLGSRVYPVANLDGVAFMAILPAGEGMCPYLPHIGPCEGGYGPGYPHVPDAATYDQKTPSPFKVQLYVHRANHNFWNREWTRKDEATQAEPPVFSRKHHELVLRAYGVAFFRAILQEMPDGADDQRRFFQGNSGSIGYLKGRIIPTLESAAFPSAGVYADTVVDPEGLVLSSRSAFSLTVDDFESVGAGSNSVRGSVMSDLVASEVDCPSAACRAYAGHTRLLIMEATCLPDTADCSEASYRTALTRSNRDLRNREAISIRVGEVVEARNLDALYDWVDPGPVSFALGLEDADGVQWVDAGVAGGVTRPYARRDSNMRWLLQTLHFQLSCFDEIDRSAVRAIHLAPIATSPGRKIAFDDILIE